MEIQTLSKNSNIKIYDDSLSLMQKKNKNLLIYSFRAILLSFFFVSFSLLLFLLPYGLFSTKVITSYALIFNFSLPIYEELNFVFIFRLTLLGFVYFYTLFKAYMQISKNQMHFRPYLIWIFLYLALSLSAFLLFFTYHNQFIKNTLNLIFILIPLLLVDISYTTFLYKTKKKLQPIVYANKTPLIIDITSRILLVLGTISIFFIWVYIDKDHIMLVGNKFYNFINKTLREKGFLNFLVITLFTIIFILLIIGLNIYKIWELIYKQSNPEIYKYKTQIYLVGILSLGIWLISLLFVRIPEQHEIFGANSTLKYLNILFGFFNLLVAAGLSCLFYVKKIKIKSYLIKCIWVIFIQLVIWAIFLISSFINTQSNINIINLIFSSIASIFVWYVYIKSNKETSLLNAILVATNIFVLLILISIFGFNHVLLSKNNSAFFLFNSILNLGQIIAISIVSLEIIYLSYLLINLGITIKKASFLEKNNLGEHHENKERQNTK